MMCTYFLLQRALCVQPFVGGSSDVIQLIWVYGAPFCFNTLYSLIFGHNFTIGDFLHEPT
jgi:hypothetical protein